MILTFFYFISRTQCKKNNIIHKTKTICLLFVSYCPNKSSYLLHYAEACNEFAGHISAAWRQWAKELFLKKYQKWRAIGNTVSDLTGARFELQTSRSRSKLVTAQPTGVVVNNFLLTIIFK